MTGTEKATTNGTRIAVLFELPGSLAVLYLGTYVLLDVLSDIFPLSPIGVTPWNPSTGLGFPLILLKGRAYLPLLFIAPALSAFLVHRIEAPFWVDIFAISVQGFGYAAATMFLLRQKVRFNPTLSSLNDLFLLLLVAATSSALVSLGYALVYALAGALPWEQYARVVLHYWVGDAIGICVVAPFLLSFFAAKRLPRPTLEMAAQLATILLALWAIFGLAEAWEFQLFYLLFLPTIWIAARFGLEGVSAGLFLAQAGLVMAMDWTDQPVTDVTKFQLLMLVLTLTGLFLGVAVSEQRRSLTRLRIHQEALARASRLTSLSALAAALAHELNQPLTALANYVRLVRDMIRSGEADAALETSEKAVAQVDHAGRLVRQLREFVRTGTAEVVPTPPALLVEETLQLARPFLESANIEVRVNVHNQVGPVLVDRLQIEQVLLNLLTNSVEAIASTGRNSGHIRIEVRASAENGFVEFMVNDDGPGFAPDIAAGWAPPFATAKPEGTGLGLPLSRSIIERHSGQVTLENNHTGALVTVNLPSAPRDHP